MKRFEKVLHVEYPDKSDLVRWYYELAKYLQETPIPYGEELEIIIEKYLDEHPIAGGVTSVNGQKGDVTVTPENIDALPIDGGVLTGDLAIVVNGAQILLTTTTDGQAQIVLNGENDVDARTAITASTDGHLYLTVGDKIYQVYDSGNFTPSGGAVDSVNGKTGAVQLTAQDVGALPDTYTAPVNSVNGEAGNVYVKTLYDNYPTSSFTASADNGSAKAVWDFAGLQHTIEVEHDGVLLANGVEQYSRAYPDVYRDTDAVTLNAYVVSGFMSSSNSIIYLTVHLGKPIIATRAVAVFDTLRVRQNGAYLANSGTTPLSSATVDNITVTICGGDAVTIKLYKSWGGQNNSTVGAEFASLRIAFGED